MRSKCGIFTWLVGSVTGLVLVCGIAGADQFHYNNMLLGDRAMGLGGAYGGVADDASGIYYNPAGLAFALSNDISGSVNIPISSRKAVYKKAIGDKDFVERSQGSFAPFVGSIQKLDQYVDGLVGGFALYYTDTNQKDQDDLIENTPYKGNVIQRYHRAVNERSSTYYFPALAAGYRLMSNVAIGFGISGFTIGELVQEYQDTQSYNPANGTVSILMQDIRQNLTAMGLEPMIGVQMAFAGRFSLGLTIKQAIIMSESCDFNLEKRVTAVSKATSDTIDANPGAWVNGATANISETISYTKYKKPLGGWPFQTRLGFAWFASTRLLWTADVMYYGAVKKGEEMYKKDPVMNYATGAEYYVTPSFPLRVGLFTNNDSRPKIKSGDANKRDHIDFFGTSLFLGYSQPNSQIAVGGAVQQGNGKAQKTGGTDTQDVEALVYTFGFAMTQVL